jgi:hypothetical protein
MKITHNSEDRTWLVMGDSDSIMFRSEEGCSPVTFTLCAGNGMMGALYALHGLHNLTGPDMWSWIQDIQPEFTEVE